MKEGTLYPILHGLEKDGLVTAREQAAPSGRRRGCGHITAAGVGGAGEEGQGGGS